MARIQFRSLLLTAIALFVGVRPTGAQAPAGSPIPALPDSMLARIADEATTPEGFELSVFAGPPHLTYPTCLQPAGEGVLFVCTDPNLLFGRERYRGRILRFVDDEGDGVADRYTVFADSLDAVRGIAWDGESVYVMHAPTLAAYRDTDGDGVADERRVLVRALGFGLEDRNGDHTANGLRLGIDGWIYAAIGDYGFLGATGADGTQISMHRGGVVRVRPDGSELEIVARGTRNIYDVALDPQLRIFARDNTNNGQAWNSRFHYLPTGADAGYPSLFRSFPGEAQAPLADFGAGAATTALWADGAGLPPGLSDVILSADWALNRVYSHHLTERGATFEITQADLMTIPRPVDLELDPAGNLFIASLSGGSYDYAGEHVGYVVRLRPTGASTEAGGDATALLDALLSSSSTRRVAAQQEILRQGPKEGVVAALERAVGDASLTTAARTAAVFTLKQLVGSEAHPVLLRAAADPAVRAMALRALTDRRGELARVPLTPFRDAVQEADPFVRLQGVTGLSRLGGRAAAEALMRAATSEDATVSHVARNALGGMGADAVEVAFAALDAGGDTQREAALQVLTRMYSPTVITALVDRLEDTAGEAHRDIVAALARLHHREGYWDGSWWGNQPNTEGPYFDPVRWEESPRIRAALLDEIEGVAGEELALLLETLQREGLIPRESAPLLRMAGDLPSSERRRLSDALVGDREVGEEAFALLASFAASSRDAREAVARVLVALPAPPPAAAPAIAEAALSSTLDADLRGLALSALTRTPPGSDPALTIGAFAGILPELSSHPPLMQAWRRFVNDRARADALEDFIGVSAGGTLAEQTVAFAVLVQAAALPRNPEPVRTRAARIISAAWSDPAAANALARAISLLGVEDRYAEELGRL